MVRAQALPTVSSHTLSSTTSIRSVDSRVVGLHDRGKTHSSGRHSSSLADDYRVMFCHHLVASVRVAGLCRYLCDGVCEWRKLMVGD